MKRLLTLVGGLALLAAVPAGPVRAQTPPPAPTLCPTNYACSMLLTGNNPLRGTPTDGYPGGATGFFYFDANSNITGVVSFNTNGNVDANVSTGSGITVTCTSGTASTLGKLTIVRQIPGGSVTNVYDFVTAQGSIGMDLLLSAETSSTSSDTPVAVGICRAVGQPT